MLKLTSTDDPLPASLNLRRRLMTEQGKNA